MATEKAPGFNQILDPIGPKTEKAPGYGATVALPAPPEQATPSKEYAEGYIYGSSLKDHIAANQGKWDEIANAAVQTASEAALGTLESASYILDFEQHWKHLKGQETEYSNVFADALKQAKEAVKESNPIYTSNENETFQPGNFEWWAKQSPSVLGSALSLIIPAAGVAKLGKLAGLGRTGEALLATVSSRLAENTMEANQAKEEALAQGATPEEAGKQAANVWNTNWVFAATDFLEFSTLFKGFRSAAKGVQGISIAEKAAAAAKEAVAKDAKSSALRGLLTTIPAEAAEEGGQYIAQQEGVNAAVNKTDYFGAGFSERLADYVANDEFKTSVLLGAVGGAAFSGFGAAAGIGKPNPTEEQYKAQFERDYTEQSNTPLGKSLTYFKGKIANLTQRGIQKEQANYVGDTGTSERISNEDFTTQVIGHMNSGTLPRFKEALEVQSKAPDNAPEAQTLAGDYLKDTDYVIDQQAKLKAANVAPELHTPIIATQLELRQSGRLNERIERELNHLETEVVKNKELSGELINLKKMELAKNAYAQLAKTNPRFLNQAIELDKQFLAQANTPMMGVAFENIGRALHTTQDEELNRKTFQLISTSEKVKELKSDLYNLSTPQGQAAMALAKQTKQEERVIRSQVENKETPKPVLEGLLAKTQNEALKGEIQNRINQVVDEQKEANKAKVEDAVNPGPPLPAVDTEPTIPEPTVSEDTTSPDLTDLEPTFEPEITETLPDLTEPEPTIPEPVIPETFSSVADVFAAIEREQPKEEKPLEDTPQKEARVTQQIVKDTGTVITRLKQLAGKWVNGEFEVALDENKVPIEQEYFDNQTGKLVPLSEVFDSDSYGNLTINTPNTKEGDEVVLKVVDNGKDKRARFSLTPGFIPTGEHNYVIQVFRVDKAGRAYPKPLTELPSGDSPQGNDPATLSKLRQAVLSSPNGIFSTTISSHSIGNVRIASAPHSLEIFTHDYKFDEDLEVWAYGKLEHKPIIAVSKLNNDIATPNIDRMKGVPNNIKVAIKETEIRDRGGKELHPGMRFVYRTNAQGNQQLVQLEGRKLNEAEITWLKKNMITYFQSGDIGSLEEVLYVRKSSQGIFSTHKGQKERDIVKAGGRQLILIMNTKGRTSVLVPLTQAKNHNQWVNLSLPEFDNLVNDHPFSYQKVNPVNGEMLNLLYSSTKEPIEKVANIQRALANLLANSFRNMREESINSEHEYVDLVTDEKYPTYYDFLVKTETATAKVPGSVGIGSGADNSYSFYNSGLRLNVNPNSITVTESVEGQVTLEDKSAIPPPVETKKSEGKTRRERILGQSEKTRLVTKEGFETIGEKEYEWFTSVFGESSLEIIKDVDRVLSKGGKEAFGIYHNALVKLAELGETGTLYHEALHFILDPRLGLITENRRARIFEEAKTVYGRKSEGVLEELLAEDFRRYQLSGGKAAPAVKASKNIFARLYNAIKRLLGIRSPIENLFRDVNRLNPSLEQRLFFAETRRRGFNDASTDEKTRLLPGFLVYRQQVEAVEVSAYQIMNYLWNMAKETGLQVEELLTAKAEKGETSILDDSFEVLRRRYEEDYRRIHAIPRDSRNDDDYTRHDSYLSMGVVEKISNPDADDKEALGSWNDVVGDLNVETGFKTEVLKQFTKYGFRVKLSDNTFITPGQETSEEALSDNESQEDVTEISESEKKEDMHGLDVTMKDPIKNLSQTIKMFLASIPDPNRKTRFGLPVPIDFNKAFGNLSTKLADSLVPLNTLHDLADKDPLLKAIFDKLVEEVQQGNTSLIAEFNTRLNLTSTNFVTFLDTYKGGLHIATMIETDRNSAHRALLNKWKEGFTNNLLKADGTVNRATTTLNLNRIRKFKTEYEQSQRQRNALPYFRLKQEVESILAGLKIVLPSEVWTILESDRPVVQRRTLERWLFGLQRDSLEDLFSTMLTTGDLPGKTILNELADKSKIFTDISDGGVFLDEKNNQRYPVNLPSMASDLINKIKRNGREVAAHYEQDKFYKDNAFVELIKTEAGVAKLEKIEVSAYRKGEQDAKDFQERTPADSALIRMIAFSNSGGNSGAIFLGTHEAKLKHTLLMLPKYKDNTTALAFLKRVLVGTVNSEITRIQRLKKASVRTSTNDPLPSDIEVFNTRGRNFVYIPSLNAVRGLTGSITEGEISIEEQAEANKERDKRINEFIDEQYKGFTEELVKHGVISLTKEGVIVNELIPDGLFEGKTVETFLKNFFYNDLGWRFELSKVFNGDLAFYKSDDDYFKRGYQTVTPGTKPYNDPEKPTNFRTVIIKGQVHPGVKNGRDSQTVISVGAYRSIAQPLGDWTKEHELVYQFAWKHGMTINQAIVSNGTSQEQSKLWRRLASKVTTPPLKPFQFSEKVITLPNGDKMIVKEQIKDSRAVLNPEFAVRHPEYRKLLTWMSENNIDVVVDEDAVKVGKYGTVDISRPVEPWEVHNHSMDDLRLPQLNPDTPKTEVSGSQYHKLILGNIDREADYGGIKGQALLEEYGEAWSEVHEKEAKDLQERFGLGADYQLSTDRTKRLAQLRKIKDLLLQELMSRNLNENYADSLKIILGQLGEPKFVASLAFPLNSTKFVGTLTNLFKRSFLNPKSPGFSGVNFADYVTGQKSDANLKFITNEKGVVTEAEIGMPVSFFQKIGLNYRDFAEFTEQGKTGKLDWNKLSKEQQSALQGIVYRIPTSNKSSMTPVRIVQVIPPNMGQIVMVPAEMLTQQGLDFDYDKSQVLLRPLDKSGKVDKEDPHTRIFNVGWSVLTSQHHYEEMLTPLTSVNIKKISDEYKAKEQGKWLSPMNTAKDIIAEEQNRDSKIMVGTLSRFNTAHATLQVLEPYVHVGNKAEINITAKDDKYRFVQLGRRLDAKGRPISESFGEYQSAALDSGKDPILFYLSMNKSTASTVSTMLLYGMDPQLITTFFKQPIIQVWLENMRRENNSLTALDTTLDTYPGLRTKYSDYASGKSTIKLTEDGLEHSLPVSIPDNLDYQARVLQEFTNITTIARVANALSSVLSIDTFQDMTGPESLEVKLNQVFDLIKPTSLIQINPIVFDYKNAPKEAKRVASLYKHALLDNLSLVEQFYPYTNTSYAQAKLAFEGITEALLYDKKTIKKLNQFLDYYILEVSNMINPILDKLAPGQSERWRYTDVDRSIFEHLTTMTTRYPELRQNRFITAIRKSYSTFDGVQMIGVNNSNSRINKTELTQAWRDLMLDLNKDKRTLAYDLVRFAITTSGFGYNTRSFADLIPIDFFIENGITESHYAALNGLIPANPGEPASTQLDSAGAVRSFVRHQFRNLDEITEVRVAWSEGKKGENILRPGKLTSVKFDQGTRHIKEFMIPADSSLRNRNKIGNFVKINTPTIIKDRKIPHYRLYEANPMNPNQFREVQPLGEDRAFFEITMDGKNKTKLQNNLNHGSPDPWADPLTPGTSTPTTPTTPITPTNQPVAPKAKIPQNLVSGVMAYGTVQHATPEIKAILGPNPHSIDMIIAGLRTRTTRSVGEMEKYNIKVGDIIEHYGRAADGSTKTVLARVTAIHSKGSPGFLGTWYKEGWTQEGVTSIERFKDGAAAIEFDLLGRVEPRELEGAAYDSEPSSPSADDYEDEGTTQVPDCSK